MIGQRACRQQRNVEIVSRDICRSTNDLNVVAVGLQTPRDCHAVALQTAVAEQSDDRERDTDSRLLGDASAR
jgi:hypothetical protein